MSTELRKAREQADAMHQLLAEVQRAVHDSDGHIVELRHGADCLHRHLLTTKGLILRKVHDKGRVEHAAAAHTQEHLNAIVEENASLRLGHAELLSRLNATAQELEQQKKLGAEAAELHASKLLAQERTNVQTQAMYEQAQAKLDKLDGRERLYEHNSGVVKDQNETLAKELSALHRQVEEQQRYTLDLEQSLAFTKGSLAFEQQMFSDLETKFMGLQRKFTDAAAATIAKSSDLASLRREIMAMETIQQDLEKEKEKLQKELTVVKSECSLLKGKALHDITALKQELLVAQGKLFLKEVHITSDDSEWRNLELCEFTENSLNQELQAAKEEIKRAFGARDMLQKQLTEAKGSGSGGGTSDHSTLSLMFQVDDLQSKLAKAEAVAAAAGTSKREEELQKMYDALKRKLKSHEETAMEMMEKQKLQLKKYKEKITALQAAQAGASAKQQAALVQDKENVRAQ